MNASGTADADESKRMSVYFNGTGDDKGQLNIGFFSGSWHPFGTVAPYFELSSTTYSPLDGVTPTHIMVTYNKNRDVNNLKLYVNGVFEDGHNITETWAASGNFFSVGSRIAGTAPFYGKIEEMAWYPKEYVCVPNVGNYEYDTSYITDFTGSGSKNHQARLFAFDYHNIRGGSRLQVARSNGAAWKVTGV